MKHYRYRCSEKKDKRCQEIIVLAKDGESPDTVKENSKINACWFCGATMEYVKNGG